MLLVVVFIHEQNWPRNGCFPRARWERRGALAIPWPRGHGPPPGRRRRVSLGFRRLCQRGGVAGSVGSRPDAGAVRGRAQPCPGVDAAGGSRAKGQRPSPGRVRDPRKQQLAEGARSVAGAGWSGEGRWELLGNPSQAEFPNATLQVALPMSEAAAPTRSCSVCQEWKCLSRNWCNA